MTQEASNLLDISSLDLRQLRGLFKLTLKDVVEEINRRGRVRGVSEPWLSNVETSKHRISPRRQRMIRRAILRLAAREASEEEAR